MLRAVLKKDRLDHWVGRGAQISESLAKVIREQAKAPAPAAG
jgi:ribosomal protein S16